MKRILALLLVLLMSLSTFACAATAPQAKVMTSFYPMYIFALNVFDGIDEITVECMTAPQTGCLHDYQLVVSDMMKLSESDMFIVCGAGMEAYLSDVKAQFADLLVVDCSQGLDLICDDSDHAHAEDTHDHSVNPHTWLDVDNATAIVDTIASEGMTLFPYAADRIFENAKSYIARLSVLQEEMKSLLEPFSGKKIVTFHEAFPYFAQAYDLEIAAVIAQEHDEALSPAQIAKVIDLVVQAGIPPLFTEPQYASNAAATISAETGAKIYELDPVVTGEISLTAYEDAMQKNAQTIVSAFD